MSICQKVRSCPASHYMNCVAFDTDRNCWEVADKPCCKRRDLSRCAECPIYLEAEQAMGGADTAAAD
ncbi:MAG: hypothetical protein ACE5R4_11460 [Armatimonadota bacterium]